MDESAQLKNFTRILTRYKSKLSSQSLSEIKSLVSQQQQRAGASKHVLFLGGFNSSFPEAAAHNFHLTACQCTAQLYSQKLRSSIVGTGHQMCILSTPRFSPEKVSSSCVSLPDPRNTF